MKKNDGFFIFGITLSLSPSLSLCQCSDLWLSLNEGHMSLPTVRFVPPSSRLPRKTTTTHISRCAAIKIACRSKTDLQFFGVCFGQPVPTYGTVGYHTEFERADLWSVWCCWCFVETGEKCKMRGEKRWQLTTEPLINLRCKVVLTHRKLGMQRKALLFPT